VDNSYSEELHERMVAQKDRTRPPESFPALPDIPLARYTDPYFYQAEIDTARRYRGGDGRQAERSRLSTLVGLLHATQEKPDGEPSSSGAVKHLGGQPPNNSQCRVPTTQPTSMEG